MTLLLAMTWAEDLNFWSVVVFVLLLGLLARYAVGPLTRALRGRQETIEDQLRQVDEAQRQIRALMLEHEERKRQLRLQATEMVQEAKRDAEATRVEMLDRAKQEVSKIKARAIREIELAKRTAMHQLADRASEESLRIARERLESDLADGDHARLIQSAIEEMMRDASGKPGGGV